MDSKLARTLALVGSAAAFAAPAAAAAKGGHGHGRGHGHAQAPLAGHGHGHGHKAPKGKNVVVRGTVASVAGNVVTVDVTGGNHRGRALKGQQVQFDVTGVKRLVVADVNGDGTRDLADVAQGDAVVVQARIADGDAQPFAARHFVDQGAPGTDASGGDDASQAD